MARRSFVYAAFTPAVWRNLTVQAPALDGTVTIAELAPEDVDRRHLITTFSEAVTVHDDFRSYSVRHDSVKPVMEYVAGTDDNPNPNETREARIAHPLDFYLYEFVSDHGQAYVGASETVVRQMFRRALETNGPGVELHVRNVDLEDLERELQDASSLRVAEVIGYKLVRVRSDTPLRNLDVLGQDISNNHEVQDAKNRAGRVRAFAVRLLYGNRLVEVWIGEGGNVSFLDYPGDEPALGLLATLHPIITGCSSPKGVRGS